ncbi:hypothetical protein BJP62_09595 [Jeongeupia sp. USM3]|nr:hypothetical protein BJP62_09595 [Jeongeupia sp. USM3]
MAAPAVTDSKKSSFVAFANVANAAFNLPNDVSLDVFGHDLFANMSSAYLPLQNAQVNGDYIVGPGDEIQIRGWGMVDIDLNVVVDRNGAIYLPRVGNVQVAGIKYRDLQSSLKKAINRVFTNFDLTAAIAQPRSVQVYVVGMARAPGSYSFSAMSTLLNAVFAAGGPSQNGSMREIKLKRAGKIIGRFDLYDLLVNGQRDNDQQLQDGDVILMSPAKAMVAVSGNVKRPAIYEMKSGETLADLLAWAGGTDSAAEGLPVIVEKQLERQFKPVATVDRAHGGDGFAAIKLHPSDIYRLVVPQAFAVAPRIGSEYVRLGGEVAHPGVYQLQSGETLRQLVARAGGVTESGYLFAAELTRESVRQQQQQRLEEVLDRFEQESQNAANARLTTLSNTDNVQAINQQAERNRKQIEKMRGLKASGRIVLNLPGPQSTVADLPEIPLQNGDSFAIPRFPGTVYVLGAVQSQNAFVYRKDRSVADYVKLAGGPTRYADDSYTYLIRADGSVESRQQSWFSSVDGLKVYPGDTVALPIRADYSSWTQELKEWAQIFYQFGLGAAGIKVLTD